MTETARNEIEVLLNLLKESNVNISGNLSMMNTADWVTDLKGMKI